MNSPRRHLRAQDGAAAVELVLVTPLIVVLLLFTAAGGRLAAAKGDVQAAAVDAARAATIARDPVTATAVAGQAAQDSLASGIAPCASTDTSVDLARFVPGGTVTVQVTCQVLLADLGLLGLPGTRAVTGAATAPVDRFRGMS